MAGIVTGRRSPYVGPRAFATGETLYGRDREVQKLLNLLIAERIVLLYAPSGAGKTSLLQAGLIPLLREEQFQTLPVVRVSLEPPLPTNADRTRPTANRYLLSTLLSLEESRLPEQRLPLAELAGLDLAAYLARQPPSADQAPVERVLIFDQFEEVLTVDPTDHDAKSAFFAALGEALRDRQVWALFALREDNLAGLDPYLRPIPTRLRSTFRLDLLGEEAARLAIQRPARDAGVDFSDGAAQKLVDDLRLVRVQRPDGASEEQPGPDVEPVQLQVVCSRLWRQLRPDATEIVPSDVESVGSVNEALAGYYAERVAAIATRAGASERAIREWVDERLITVQEIRGQVLQGVKESEGLDNRAIQALVDAHLVRSERRRGFTWFELAHDRLIGPVHRDNATWFETHLSELQRQAARWDKQDRPTGLLARGAELQPLEAWAGEHAEELTTPEREFLVACREAAAVARRELRTNLLVRALLAVMTILAVVAFFYFEQAKGDQQTAVEQKATAVAAGAIAVGERNRADDARATAIGESNNANIARTTAVAESLRAAAEASIAQDQKATAVSAGATAIAAVRVALWRQLMAQGLSLVDSQPDLALLMSVQAYRMTPSLEARSDLLSVLVSTTRLIALLRGGGYPVNSVVFSHDGKLLASASDDKMIYFWDVASKQPIGAPLVGHTGTVLCLALSPDGNTLASGSDDMTVRLWNVATRQPIGPPLTGHSSKVWSVAFSPDGKTVASASADGTIRLWDAVTHKPVGAPLTGHTGGVRSVAFSPDSKTVASAGEDGTIRWWDVASQKPIGEPLQGHAGGVMGVAFRPDGKVLASAGDDWSVRQWDVAGHSPLSQVQAGFLGGHYGGVRSVTFSPDGKTLASASDDNTIRVWDATTGQLVGPPLTGHTGAVVSVAFSPDSKTVASASFDKTVGLWNVVFPQSLGSPLAGQITSPSVAFGPDSKTLALAGGDGTIWLWDAVTHRPVGPPLTGHTIGVRSVAFSPDSKTVASGGEDGTIRLWDIATQQPIGQPLVRHTAGVRRMTFSPDGKILASASADQTVRLWDLASGQAIGSPFISQTGRFWTVAFSPDGKILAAAGDEGTIRLWDVASQQLIGAPLTDHLGAIYCVAFSSDGKILASAGNDRTIRLWDVAIRKPIGAPLVGHIGAIWTVAFSPDGKTLASAGDDQTDRLWDATSQQPVGPPLRGHTKPVHSVTFSPDGKTLASASDDETIRLWDADIEGWIAHACGTANRNLSTAEWQKYLGSEPYEKTCPDLP